MNPETVLDIFFDAMEQTHWSTDTEAIETARASTLRVCAQSILWDLRKWATPVAPETEKIAEPSAQQDGEDG